MTDEDFEQIALMKWATTLSPHKALLLKYLFHIPNGGYRNPREAAKLKRMGVMPGVADLCLAYSSGGYHSLWIELKRRKPKGIVTPNQKEFLKNMRAVGSCTAIAYGWEEAKEVIERYLGMSILC